MMWSRLRRWALLDPSHSLWDELKLWDHQRKRPFRLGNKSSGPFGRGRALRFWFVLLVLLASSHLLAQIWVFEYAGLWSADMLARLRPPESAQLTGLVTITKEERQNLLSGISPVPARNLLQAVCAVLREARPKVLGIDIDTSHVKIEKLPHTPTKIVWAQGVQISRQVISHAEDKITVRQDYVLGQAKPHVLSGLAIVPVTPDWSVRTIPLCYEYDEQRVMPTMLAAMAKAAGHPIADCNKRESGIEESAYRIHYSFERFTLSEFSPQTIDQTALERCQRGEGEWAETAAPHHPFNGREVVLLGGEYDLQDWHPTPFGFKPGVEVLASLTEHLLRNSGSHEIGLWTQEVPMKLLFALAIAWIHCRFRPMAALLLCLVGLGGLVLAGGLLAVYFTTYRAATVPFLLGIVIEQLVTSAERAQEGGGHTKSHSGAALSGAGAGSTGHP